MTLCIKGDWKIRLFSFAYSLHQEQTSEHSSSHYLLLNELKFVCAAFILQHFFSSNFFFLPNRKLSARLLIHRSSSALSFINIFFSSTKIQLQILYFIEFLHKSIPATSSATKQKFVSTAAALQFFNSAHFQSLSSFNQSELLL